MSLKHIRFLKQASLLFKALTIAGAMSFAASSYASTSESYCYNETTTASGPNTCSTDAQCDGARTCNAAGWCQGVSRPAGSNLCKAMICKTRVEAKSAEIDEMYKTYGTYTGNISAGNKQALKRQIVLATDELNVMKADCPCYGEKDELEKKVNDMHLKYNSMTHNNQAGEKQVLKAQIVAETNRLNALKSECGV